MTNESDQILETVEAAAEVVKDKPVSNTVTLSNGVILKCKAVPIMTIRHAASTIPKPKPPIVKNEDKGRDEVWEGDPAYQEALTDWEEKVGDVGTNVLLMLGTSIEFVPEDINRPEDNGWLEILRATGIEVNADSVPARYISWLRFYAIATPSDLLAVTTNIAEKSGVMNKDVQASLDSFRSGEGRGTDLETETSERSGNGDSVPRTNGRSHLRSGREG